MPNYTKNLKLFKYDPSTDGDMPFDIQQALNNNWDKLDSSTGAFELCDIGMSLYVDESKGKRRYLNGQIVDINTNTLPFLERLQKIVSLYPSLSCTEENWQTAKTLSAFGQVGKFVFNYAEDGVTIESVRLPRVVNVQGLFDLANLGMTVSAGLPNITGTATLEERAQSSTPTGTGAFSVATHTIGYSGYSKGDGYGTAITFNASKSNSIYGNSDTVQEEAIQYPYFIQIATGVETENNIINEIELNIPFSFGDSKYSPVELNNLSWLKSEGQWNSKAVYPDYYDWILENVNNEVEGFKKSTDTYDDYDWVVNTEDETFRLPVLDGSEDLIGYDVETYDIPTFDGQSYIAKHNGLLQLFATSTIVNQYIRVSNKTTGEIDEMRTPLSGVANVVNVWVNRNDNFVITGDVVSSITSVKGLKAKGNGSLYYYVGETVQNANLIDAGRLSETKADKTAVDGQWVFVKKHLFLRREFTELELLVTDLSEILPKDGYVYECLFSAYIRTGTGSGNTTGCTLGYGTRTAEEVSNFGVRLCRVVTRTSSSMAASGNCILPIYPNDRAVSWYNQDASGTSGNCGLTLYAYRRVGTNV